MNGTQKPPSPAPGLTIVQDRKLNPLLIAHRKWTWRQRCMLFLIGSVAFSCLFFPLFELTWIANWLNDKPLSNDRMLGEFAVVILLGLSAVAVWDLEIWLDKIKQRQFTISEDGLTFDKWNFLSWNNVSGLKLVPVQGRDDLAKLSISYEGRRVKNRREIRIALGKRTILRWFILLRNPGQIIELRNQLAALRENRINVPELIEAKTDDQSSVRKVDLLSLLPVTVAVMLLLNGLFLCAFGWGIANPSSPSVSRPMTKHQKQLNRVLYSVFSSPSEIAITSFTAGGTMIAAGLSLYAYCMVVQRRRQPEKSEDRN